MAAHVSERLEMAVSTPVSMLLSPFGGRGAGGRGLGAPGEHVREEDHAGATGISYRNWLLGGACGDLVGSGGCRRGALYRRGPSGHQVLQGWEHRVGGMASKALAHEVFGCFRHGIDVFGSVFGSLHLRPSFEAPVRRKRGGCQPLAFQLPSFERSTPAFTTKKALTEHHWLPPNSGQCKARGL